MNTTNRVNPRASTDILAIGFGVTVAMWAAGYICRFPAIFAPASLLLFLFLACLLAGGYVAGRFTARGITGGVYVGALASVVNLLIIGSVITGDGDGALVPSALFWIPGSILAGALTSAIGAAVGNTAGKGRDRALNWRLLFAVVLATSTLLLLLIGGLVTSREAGLAVVDWPNSFGYNMFLYPLSRMTGDIYYEHAHRLFGSLVGLTTLVFMVNTFTTESRGWMKWLSVAALLAVIAQGVLGGLRVTGTFTLSTDPSFVSPSIRLAIVHGVLAHIFFALVIALAVFSSSAWRSGWKPGHREVTVTDHTLSILLPAVILIQLVLGAILRHIYNGLFIHIAFAVIVVLVTVLAGVRAWGIFTEETIISRTGAFLLHTLWLQVILGFAAFIVQGGSPSEGGTTILQEILPTLHLGVGAVLLAFSVMLLLWYRMPVARQGGPVA